jgi:hypothetical protein
VILKWVKEAYWTDVIAFCADIRKEKEWDGEKALIAPIFGFV